MPRHDGPLLELVPPGPKDYLSAMRAESNLRRGAMEYPQLDFWLHPASFEPMTLAEGKETLDWLLRGVQKVRSNLAEARTGYMMPTDEWERRYGSFDDDQMLREYAPRLYGPHSIVEQVVDLALAPTFAPIDLFNLFVVMLDDQILKVHLLDWGLLHHRLPALLGWVDERGD